MLIKRTKICSWTFLSGLTVWNSNKSFIGKREKKYEMHACEGEITERFEFSAAAIYDP